MKRIVFATTWLPMVVLLSAATAFGQGLLVNGDFWNGTNGFTSQYTYVTPNGTIHTEVGEYSIVVNPATAFTNGYASFTSPNGLMLFADGGSPGSFFWSQTLNLAPGSYTFSCLVANADPTLWNPAILALYVNGTNAGSNFTIAQPGGIWEQWTVHFEITSGGSTTLALTDLNQNPGAGGDDFVVSGLSLKTQ
jgi:hypothetical protein